MDHNDIVERLRDAAALPTGLYAEAADEIEKYRKAQQAFYTPNAALEARIAELDRIATELQITCDKQSKRITELIELVRMQHEVLQLMINSYDDSYEEVLEAIKAYEEFDKS